MKCIDVSTWQGIIDWKKVKSQGYSYAILRAGFGRSESQIDNRFERNFSEASKQGIALGVYWYSYATDVADARREAQACLSVLGGRGLRLPVFYDMEEDTMTSLGKSTLTAMAKAFCDAVIEGGYRAGVYANPNWFTNYLDYASLRAAYPIWLAQWSDAPRLECDIWQYTSEGKVDGIAGNVDLNTIYNPSVVVDATPGSDSIRAGESGIASLCLKYLLQIADDMNLVPYGMTLGNDIFGKGTTEAVREYQRRMGLPVNGVADSQFADRLYLLIKDNYPVVGDVNSDGAVDVRDATEIQKRIAGV